MPISIEEPEKRYCEVLGKKMAYSELGSGPPIVFLHGNPASSYIWHNLMPHAASQARCIAPDLIGMGNSEKLEGTDPDRYGFLQHRRFVGGLLEKLNVTKDIVLVGHDWAGRSPWIGRAAIQVRCVASSISRRSCARGVGTRWIPDTDADHDRAAAERRASGRRRGMVGAFPQSPRARF